MAQDYTPRRGQREEPRPQRTRQQSPQQTPPKKRRRKNGGAATAALFVIFVIGLSVLLAAVGWVLANDVLALNKPAQTATITLPEDIFTYTQVTDAEGKTKQVSSADMGYVTNELAKNDLVEFKWLFKLFCGVTKGGNKLTAGTYELSTDMDYRAIIQNMSASSSTRHEISVTIPEGLTLMQTFQLLEEKGVSTVEKLSDKAATHDYNFSFLKEQPLGDAKRLEGYLFPDTYKFYVGENPLYVLNKMLVNFDAKVTDEMRQAAVDKGMTLHQIINIAAMIEKETDGTDHATISSVIYNRMENLSGGTNGYLQIDATIAYVTGRNVTQADYKGVNSPYNTYENIGLPPGPISNPGLISIRAALNPKNTSYYYYSLGNDGIHQFFRTYEEHLAFIEQQKNERAS